MRRPSCYLRISDYRTCRDKFPWRSWTARRSENHTLDPPTRHREPERIELCITIRAVANTFIKHGGTGAFGKYRSVTPSFLIPCRYRKPRRWKPLPNTSHRSRFSVPNIEIIKRTRFYLLTAPDIYRHRHYITLHERLLLRVFVSPATPIYGQMPRVWLPDIRFYQWYDKFCYNTIMLLYYFTGRIPSFTDRIMLAWMGW